MFEYAACDGEIWGDVTTAKQLLTRVAHHFWTIDPQRLAAAEHGGFVREESEPGKAHTRLPSGLYLYTGRANQWLLSVAQGYIEAFDLHDKVKVRFAAPAARTD